MAHRIVLFIPMVTLLSVSVTRRLGRHVSSEAAQSDCCSIREMRHATKRLFVLARRQAGEDRGEGHPRCSSSAFA